MWYMHKNAPVSLRSTTLSSYLAITECFFIRDGGILWGRICLEGSGDRVEWGSSWSGINFFGIREHLCRTFTGTMYNSLCWSCTRGVVKMCL